MLHAQIHNRARPVLLGITYQQAQDGHREGTPPADFDLLDGEDRRTDHNPIFSTDEESSMATYITTIKFTQQGIKNFRKSPKRAAALKAAAKKMGVEVTNIYWTLGDSDGVLIFNAPDEVTATAAMLYLSSQGNVHTATSRAFDSSEIEKVIGLLGKK